MIEKSLYCILVGLGTEVYTADFNERSTKEPASAIILARSSSCFY